MCLSVCVCVSETVSVSEQVCVCVCVCVFAFECGEMMPLDARRSSAECRVERLSTLVEEIEGFPLDARRGTVVVSRRPPENFNLPPRDFL